MLGDLVWGSVAASYGGYTSAVFDTWKPVIAEEWRKPAPAPLPNPREDIDAKYWSIESIPVLGGDAFYYEGGARLDGVRLAPPPDGPRIFHKKTTGIFGARTKGRSADGGFLPRCR